MIVTALLDNCRLADPPGLIGEHGLSLHIDLDGRRLLFDTGQSGAFMDNASRLSIDISGVDAVIVSHGHYDHGGGLPRFFEINGRAPVYLKKGADGEARAKVGPLPLIKIGIEAEVFAAHAARFHFIKDEREILPGVWLLTDLPHTHPAPAGNRRLLVRRDGRLLRDDFAHELMMVIEDDGELVVFTGCAHRGIQNMIAAAMTRFPGRPIKALFGGFHLAKPVVDTLSESKERIAELARWISRETPVQKIYTGHCTGRQAYTLLKEILGDKIDYLAAGAVVEPGLPAPPDDRIVTERRGGLRKIAAPLKSLLRR